LKHIGEEVYEFNGHQINMDGCGRTHFQMYRHISEELAKRLSAAKNLLECVRLEDDTVEGGKISSLLYRRIRSFFALG
jgi:hypothetical protein